MRRKPKSRVPRSTKAWLKFLQTAGLVTYEELERQRKSDINWRLENINKLTDANDGRNFDPPR
jgi:hypothetical protein